MTSFFILVWVAISVFIIGIFIWTTRALIEQKKSWKNFASARNLKFVPNGFFQSALVTGKLSGYDFILISDERASDDIRGRKFVTMIQFGLPGLMPGPAVVGSGEYRKFVDDMPARDPLGITIDGAAAKTDDLNKVMGYFTSDRVRVLDTLVKQKGVSVLFLFDERAAFLRLETADPLYKPGQLDKLVDKILPLLKTLAP